MAKSAKNETQRKNVEALVCGVSVTGKQDSWVLDSGVTDHMNKRRDWFTTFEQYDDIVKVGDGRAIKAAGKGDINVLVNDGQEWVQNVLTNALYVPDITYNFFSLSKAVDRGFHFRSDSGN